MRYGIKIIIALLLPIVMTSALAQQAFAAEDDAAVSGYAEKKEAEPTEVTTSDENEGYGLSRNESDLAATAAGVDDIAPVQTDNIPDITKINPSADGFTLSYSSYPGAAKYRVFIRKADDSGWKKVGDSTSLTYKHRYLVSGAEYRYTVRALDKKNNFISGYNKEGHTVRFFSVPTLSSVSSVFGGIKLTWKAMNGAPKYKVYIQSGSSWKSLGFTESNSFVYENVRSGLSYTFTVRAYSTDGLQAYSYYNKNGISGIYYPSPVISGFSPVDGGTSIKWDPTYGAVKYRVFYKGETGWKKIGDTELLHYDHTGLNDRDGFIYTVRAMDKNNKYISGYDPEGSRRVYFAPPEIAEISYKKGVYSVRWEPSADVAGYRLYRKEFGGDWMEIDNIRTDFASSYSDAETEANKLYTYTLACLDEEGEPVSVYSTDTPYYLNGVLANGEIPVNGNTLHFEKGYIRQGYVVIGGKTYYFDKNGVMKKNAIVGTTKLGYTVADKNGVCCVTEEIKLAATYMMKYCTGKNREERMKSGFMYMAKNFPYSRSYDHPKNAADIPALAIDMFTNEKGNCFRYAAAFACVAKAAGHRSRMVIGYTGSNPHGWVEVLVDGQWLICDPDANIPSYRRADYAAYMMKQHFWPLTPKTRCEVVIDDYGVATWK